MASSASLPYDPGSHQELINSVLVGRSFDDPAWNERAQRGPCVGVEIRDGPILIDGNVFRKFWPSVERFSYAVGFYPNNSGQNSPLNTFGRNSFDDASVRLYMGQAGGYYGDHDKDGDRTQIVYDRDGSVSGRARSYVVRSDNGLLNTERCRPATTVDNGAVCSDDAFGQLFVNVTVRNASLLIEDVTLNTSMTLRGVDADDFQTDLTSTQYQPVLVANHTYRLTWTSHVTPDSVDLSVYNLPQYSALTLEIHYPIGTTLTVTQRVWNQITDRVISRSHVDASTTLDALVRYISGPTYYFDNATGWLRVKLVNVWPVDDADPYNYCPADGCRFVNVVANSFKL